MQAQGTTFQTVGPDRRPGASRHAPRASTNVRPEIHYTAARQDGIVKILIGILFVVFSLGLVALAVVALYALLANNDFKLWALLLGIPGLILSVFGMVLIAWGSAKLLSGHGDG